MLEEGEKTGCMEGVEEMCRESEVCAKFLRVRGVVGHIAEEGWSRSLKSGILIFHHLWNINCFFQLMNVKGN